MSFLGLGDLGRPPFFTLARASMSDVSCGSSRNSLALTTCASTRPRSDFKVRRKALFFAVIGLSHAENMACSAPRDVTEHHHASLEVAVADYAGFAVVRSRVFDLHRDTGKNNCGVGEVQAPTRSAKALARLAGSQVIRTSYCSYRNHIGQTRSRLSPRIPVRPIHESLAGREQPVDAGQKAQSPH